MSHPDSSLLDRPFIMGGDHGCAQVAHALKPLIDKHLADPKTVIDSRCGERSSSLWATIDGREYFIQIRPSAKQRVKDQRK